MKKQLYILLTTLVLSFTTAQEKPAVDDAFIQENKKLCDGKNQSSAEALLKTLVACQNLGRNSELLSLIYLGTNADNYLSGGKENGINDDFVVAFTFGDEGITNKTKLSDWRENAKSALKAQDEIYDIKTAKMMKLTSIDHFMIDEEEHLETSPKNIKNIIVKFSAINLAEENSEEISSQIVRGHSKFCVTELNRQRMVKASLKVNG